MTKRMQVESTAKLAIDAREYVQIERRRHTERVVVSGFENGWVLFQICAEQQRVALVQDTTHGSEETVRLFRVEVADVGTEEQRECATSRFLAEFSESGEVIRGEGFDLQSWVRLQQDPRAAFQHRR